MANRGISYEVLLFFTYVIDLSAWILSKVDCSCLEFYDI